MVIIHLPVLSFGYMIRKVVCVHTGVYISMYSDCLDLNRWYHGKSGYIAIIRLTKVLKMEIGKFYLS